MALAVVVAIHLERSRTTYVFEQPLPAPGLAVDGDPVANIYAVDRDGEPLRFVRLHDESDVAPITTPPLLLPGEAGGRASRGP